jgi:hypothetical protein
MKFYGERKRAEAQLIDFDCLSLVPLVRGSFLASAARARFIAPRCERNPMNFVERYVYAFIRRKIVKMT